MSDVSSDCHRQLCHRSSPPLFAGQHWAPARKRRSSRPRKAWQFSSGNAWRHLRPASRPPDWWLYALRPACAEARWCGATPAATKATCHSLALNRDLAPESVWCLKT